MLCQRTSLDAGIEMKSISIMRLKLSFMERIQVLMLLNWNEKHLNYEIETLIRGGLSIPPLPIEMKSISIMRLKQSVKSDLKKKNIFYWNEKHLNYEIETLSALASRSALAHWNEKHLNYEIETMT